MPIKTITDDYKKHNGTTNQLNGLPVDDESTSSGEGLSGGLQLNESNISTMFNLVNSAAPVLCYFADTSLSFRYANHYFKNIHDISPDNMVGRSIREVIGLDGFRTNRDRYEQVLDGEQVEFEDHFTTKRGRPHFYRATYIPFFKNGTVAGFAGVVIDLTKEKITQKKLQQLASVDMLTGVFNRRQLFFDLKESVMINARYGHDFSLIMFDLDHFKTINDCKGHDVGDQVLVNVINQVRPQIRDTDRIYRFGGDEFMILLRQTRLEQAVEMAERICRAGRCQSMVDETPLTLSLGVTQYVYEPIEQFIKRCDQLLYRAKQQGRNQVQWG